MEHETFWDLLKDAAHWEFELFLMFLFDGVVGLVVLPFARRFFMRWTAHHKTDDDKLATLEHQIKALQRAHSRTRWRRHARRSDRDALALRRQRLQP